MSVTTTHGIEIQVRPEYLPAQSMPGAGRWLFAYHITITNRSLRSVQLLSRHWVITNGEGKVDEVSGPGVIGQQPTLGANAIFTYTSGCPLDTPVGTMHGEFQLVVTETGEMFEAHIAPFRLAQPGVLN